jgi:hypothetical protein
VPLSPSRLLVSADSRDPLFLKLLFDQNLSHRLVDRLRDIFPDSKHVRFVGLAYADDGPVWVMPSGTTL